VAFGSVWKQSLTELSGGQRSLLALSLILSLLMFKPAPIYILDEVDAALDLSHTQNIGRMIKTHFPQSQFVVVSLKEGMFSNANVCKQREFYPNETHDEIHLDDCFRSYLGLSVSTSRSLSLSVPPKRE
jgi:structural maintenance of chromosome 2